MTGVFSNPAGTRKYRLFVPDGNHRRALPLIVMLHGCGQDPDDFAASTRMNALAQRDGFLVLYPEQAIQANPSGCWNWFKPDDQRRGRGEPSILAGMTRHIARTHRVDASRVYVAGLSAGGAMAMILAVNYPELYAAIGVHSGLPYGAAHDLSSAFAAMRQGEGGLPAALKTLRVVPTIVFHGDRDTMVHPGNGARLLAQWATTHSETGRTLRVTANRGEVPDGHVYTRSRYHDSDGRIVMEHWLVHGAGHGWSGGNPQRAYTEPRGPDASEEILRFFRIHSLDRP